MLIKQYMRTFLSLPLITAKLRTSSRPLSHQQLAYPFLGPFLSTLFSFMHPTIHIIFLPPLLRLRFNLFPSLFFSPYTLPYFTYASSPLYFFLFLSFLSRKLRLYFFLLINFALLSFIHFLSSSSFCEFLYTRLLYTYAHATLSKYYDV